MVERVLRNEQEVKKEPGRKRALSVQASLMTPVQPMLVRTLLWPCFLFLSKVTVLTREIDHNGPAVRRRGGEKDGPG